MSTKSFSPIDSFENIKRETEKKCSDEINKMFDLYKVFYSSGDTIESCCMSPKEVFPEYRNSLAFFVYLELYRISTHIFFLSMHGLYRNAFNNIRYVLECIVQALYIDDRHPKTELPTKVEILKEVEDKREYHAIRLIGELDIGYKDRLKSAYKELSRRIHPSHEQIVDTLMDVVEQGGVPATVDCKQFSKINESMRLMYDIFFYLFLNYAPKIKESLKKNSKFIKGVKAQNLTLLSRVLNIKK